MGKWGAMVLDAENSGKRPSHQPTEPTKPILSVLSVGDPAISEKKAELYRLVGIVAKHHGFSPADIAEAIEVASRDVDGWLIEFRLLAAEIPTTTPEPVRDDRITCRQCGELTASGRCQAARDRRMVDASPEYSPVPDLPRRCEFYRRKGDETKH